MAQVKECIQKAYEVRTKYNYILTNCVLNC